LQLSLGVRPHLRFLVPPDIRTLDFAGFIALVFDHPAYEGIDVELDGNRVVRILEERPPQWYWDVDWYWSDVPADPLHTLALVTELFERADTLIGRFTPRQIAQGFQLVVGPAAQELFLSPLWDANLPWTPRERLLRSTVPLYERLFDVEVTIEHVPFMLWDDILGYRYRNPQLAHPASADDRRIQDVVADVLRDLLELDGPWSAPGALHGAHHLNHPRALQAVEHWLAKPGNDDQLWREYAEEVLRGDAM